MCSVMMYNEKYQHALKRKNGCYYVVCQHTVVRTLLVTKIHAVSS